MTPGRYLRLRRQAAGLGLDDLALPGLSVLAIERDARAPTDIEVQALTWSFRFSLTVLVSIARGVIPQICRECGCSEFDACDDGGGLGCRWDRGGPLLGVRGGEPASQAGAGGMTTRTMREDAANAAQQATTAVLDLLSIVRFGDGHRAQRDAHEAEGRLLRAIKLAMEITGFDPDEQERGALYRAITDYVSTLGEDAAE